MTRWTARLSLAAVAVIAAVASYLHALVVVQAADGHGKVAFFIPLLADLVIASAAANILDASRTGHDRPRWSMAAVGIGIVATLYANIMYGYPSHVPTWLVNGWPPVAFGLALESLVGMVKRGRQRADVSHDEHGEPVELPEAIRGLCDAYSVRKVAAAFEVPRSRVNKAMQPVTVAAADAALNGAGPHD